MAEVLKLGVTAKELAQLQAEGKLGTEDNPSGFTRANTQLIEEGHTTPLEISSKDL